MDTRTKSPAEKFPIYFCFSNDLVVGETVVSYVLTSINAATGESSAEDRAYDPGPPEVLEIVKLIYSDSLSSPDVIVVLKDGVEGDEHRIQCVATTSAGNVYQRDCLLFIQSVVDESFTKQPDDAFQFEVSFKRRLDSPEPGDTVTSAAIVAVKESDGSDAAALVSAPSVVTPKVFVPVLDGTDGETYRLGVRGTTAFGYVHEKFVRMNVQEF